MSSNNVFTFNIQNLTTSTQRSRLVQRTLQSPCHLVDSAQWCPGWYPLPPTTLSWSTPKTTSVQEITLILVSPWSRTPSPMLLATLQCVPSLLVSKVGVRYLSNRIKGYCKDKVVHITSLSPCLRMLNVLLMIIPE